ncbi:MAG: transcription antitermination protein NusB, partial [Rikenellaceae bacterium]
MRTLSSIRNSSSDIKVMRKYKNDDDRVFVKTLFERAIVNYKEYNEYIERFTTNWDAERIVMIDFIIMTVAMAEMINFVEIPIKVTLDEYIDIARYYSTNSSPTFVNGLLDMVSKSLDGEGRIKKSGRGLM